MKVLRRDEYDDLASLKGGMGWDFWTEEGPIQEVREIISRVRDGGDAAPVVIEEVKWLGLRCSVRLSGGAADLLVDIRLKAGDAGTTVAAAPKPPDASGVVSLLASDETLEGSAAFIVVSRGGAIQAQRLTVVGGG